MYEYERVLQVLWRRRVSRVVVCKVSKLAEEDAEQPDKAELVEASQGPETGVQYRGAGGFTPGLLSWPQRMSPIASSGLCFGLRCIAVRCVLS